MRRFSAWIARAGFGFFVVIAAGAALLATTFIGLLIALAALFLNVGARVMRGSQYQNQNSSFKTGGAEAMFGVKSRRETKSAKSGETLEAHKTADGWVIEPDS